MLTTSNLAKRIYALFLSLYPSSFREAFADEMHAVYTEAAAEAQSRGALALVGMVARELRDLLAGALLEYWQVFSHKEIAMSETLEINGGVGTAQVDLRGGYDPGSWKGALLAGLPHLLMGCFFVTLTMMGPNALLPSGQNLTDIVGITLAVIFMILLGVVLFFARRMGWPPWAASWIMYAGVLVFLPIMGLFQIVNESDPLRFLMFVVPLSLAVVLYKVAQRDRLKEVLIALPIMTLLWGALLEFFPPEVYVFLHLWGWTLTAAAAVVIVRQNNWRLGVWLFLTLNLLVGLAAAYAFVYLNNIPLEHAPDRTSFEVAKYLVPQLLTFSTLVLGPLLVWKLWDLGKRSGPMGVPGFQLIFWGLLMVMICIGAAVFLMESRNHILVYRFRDAAVSWCVTGAALGVLASLLGSLVLGLAAFINKTLSRPLTIILLVTVPLGLPWVFSIFYNIYGMGFWLFAPLKDSPYGIGSIIVLVWILLAAWLVTGRYWNGGSGSHEEGEHK